MNDVAKEVFKQLLTLVRLIAFIPLGVIIGILTKTLFAILVETITFGTLSSANYWTGCAIYVQTIGWFAGYYSAYLIKPKFIAPKVFIFISCLVIGIIIFSVIDMYFINDPFNDLIPGFPWSIETATELFFAVFAIPIGVLVWLVKDKKNGLYALEDALEDARKK